MHQEVIQMTVFILTIFDQTRDRKSKTKPRRSKAKQHYKHNIGNHGQGTKVVHFKFVSPFDVEKLFHFISTPFVLHALIVKFVVGVGVALYSFHDTCRRFAVIVKLVDG